MFSAKKNPTRYINFYGSIIWFINVIVIPIIFVLCIALVLILPKEVFTTTVNEYTVTFSKAAVIIFFVVLIIISVITGLITSSFIFAYGNIASDVRKMTGLIEKRVNSCCHTHQNLHIDEKSKEQQNNMSEHIDNNSDNSVKVSVNETSDSAINNFSNGINNYNNNLNNNEKNNNAPII